MVLAGLAHADGKINRVYAQEVTGKAEIVVEGEGLQRPKLSRLKGGEIYALEFDATMDGGLRTQAGNGQEVDGIRVAWMSARPTRIRVDLDLANKGATPRLEKAGGNWKVVFERKQSPATVAELVPEIQGLHVGSKVSLPREFRSTVPPTTVATALNSAPPVPQPDDVRVTLDFVDTDIVQILKALAMQSGVNIITAPGVKGNITVSLHDVTVESALKFVTSLGSVMYKQVNDTYVVAGADQLQTIILQITGEKAPQPQEPITDIYLVPFGQAAALIQSVAGGEGKGKDTVGNVTITYPPKRERSSDSGANPQITEGIVLRGPAEEVHDLQELFSKLMVKDSKTTAIETVELKYIHAGKAAEMLSHEIFGLSVIVPPPALPSVVSSSTTQGYTAGSGSGSGAGAGTGAGAGAGSGNGGAGGSSPSGGSGTGASVSSDVTTTGLPMRLILRGTAEQIVMAKDYLSRVDVAPKQVAMELRVMELNKEEALRLGIDWTILTGNGMVKVLRINQGLGDTESTPGTVGSGLINRPADVNGNSKYEPSGNVTATLDKISNRNNLIARPNLMAIDGKTADLFVGDVIRYIKQVQATQNGTTVLTDELKVGVRLTVAPRVGANNQIMLQTFNNLSYLTGWVPVPGGGQLPQTSERESTNYTLMNSGETIAIGGLITDQDRNKVSGIPILRDLPILGQLFRRSDSTKVRTEVVFFLTAKVADETNRGDAARPKDATSEKRVEQEKKGEKN